MRKVLALLLISLLSLQASWAAAASYCLHEQGAAAKHFGHHEHQHDLHVSGLPDASGPLDAPAAADVSAAAEPLPGSEAAKADANIANFQAGGDSDVVAMASTDAELAAKAGAGTDLDCGVCHAHALAGVPSAASPSPAEAAPRNLTLPLHSRLSSISLPRPERPNWHAA